MDSKNYWTIFERTGSINAYLKYKNSGEMANISQDDEQNGENVDDSAVKGNGDNANFS